MLSLRPNYFLDKIHAWALVLRSASSILAPVTVPVEEEEATAVCVKSERLAIWHKVDSELTGGLESVHHRYWWSEHTGKILAVLLYNAGYSSELQYRDLKFFSQVVAPFLGISHHTVSDDTPQWPSFMTDNGGPVELSWDWGTNGTTPKVRYSIEPIGLDAGTSLDPCNLKAGLAFRKHLKMALPDMNLEWFHHFNTFFNGRSEDVEVVKDQVDHNTSIFYAFDLSAHHITAKTYFFPKLRARKHAKSHLEVLIQAISSAPHVTDDNLEAWKLFLDFTSTKRDDALEYEMLAIDHVEPLQSRLKIYFRSRETTFDSVARTLSLGNRVKSSGFYKGLIDLARLWNYLFGVDIASDQPLDNVDHRTAGILYNIEFKLGDLCPVAKVYLPVRHYSSSDEAIMQALNQYLEGHGRDRYMPFYNDTIRTVLRASTAQPDAWNEYALSHCTADSTRTKTRVHTYIGCTIRPDGALRVVSYFSPQDPIFSSSSNGVK